MTTNLSDGDVGGLLSSVLAESEGPLLFVNPAREAIPALVDRMDDAESPPSVRLLSTEAFLKAELEDFLVAANAADLAESGSLSVRTLAEPPRSSLVISDSRVVSLVTGPERVAGLTATDESFVAEAGAHFERVWESGAEYEFRTPGLTRIRESLATDIGRQAAADFEAIIDSVPSIRGDGEGFGEVAICLLVAAKNGVLLYDVSKWGENVGLASKATFSRTKNIIEDEDLVDTEKVPIDVGRPRLRLMLDEDLRDADPVELARLARDVLEE